MENEDKFWVAEEVVFSANVLLKCEIHNIFFDGCDNEEIEAYKLGNSLISKNDALVSIFNGDRMELIDLLKDIRTKYTDCCPECERKREED